MRRRIEVVQQCRPEDLEATRRAYASAHVKAELAAFFNDLPQRMANAHLVIARSGASTLAELCVIGRPSILIPYPFATDDHQTANAKVLEQAGAAWRIQQDDLSADRLAHLLVHVFADPDNLARHAAAAKALARVDAAERLADLVETLGAAA
jgi:UDP-N-acetylglucosamine--N-acetylmuramyl-(pentapeptide) pyrophosphoryl-undecaprenol N-acetylglucosamine transferase